jgi:hypothetical protein
MGYWHLMTFTRDKSQNDSSRTSGELETGERISLKSWKDGYRLQRPVYWSEGGPLAIFLSVQNLSRLLNIDVEFSTIPLLSATVILKLASC